MRELWKTWIWSDGWLVDLYLNCKMEKKGERWSQQWLVTTLQRSSQLIDNILDVKSLSALKNGG